MQIHSPLLVGEEMQADGAHHSAPSEESEGLIILSRKESVLPRLLLVKLSQLFRVN